MFDKRGVYTNLSKRRIKFVNTFWNQISIPFFQNTPKLL